MWKNRPPLVFLLPFVIYMLLGSLEAASPSSAESFGGSLVAYRHYPLVYTLKIVLTLGTILLVWPGYKRFPIHASVWALVVGLAGIGVWVGLCMLRLEQRCLAPLGLDWLLALGRRSAYDPFHQLAAVPAIWSWAFLAVRVFGLAVVVPVVEEFFLRGFLMPICVSAEWSKVPFGTVNRTAVLVAVVYGAATHPGELFAAIVWFTLITWLMVRTKNIWDCVVAHATTNGLLAVYVVLSGNWELM